MGKINKIPLLKWQIAEVIAERRSLQIIESCEDSGLFPVYEDFNNTLKDIIHEWIMNAIKANPFREDKEQKK